MEDLIPEESWDVAQELEIPIKSAEQIIRGAHRRGFPDPIDYVQFLIDNEEKHEKQRHRSVDLP